jgi:hypothetical protein
MKEVKKAKERTVSFMEKIVSLLRDIERRYLMLFKKTGEKASLSHRSFIPLKQKIAHY